MKKRLLLGLFSLFMLGGTNGIFTSTSSDSLKANVYKRERGIKKANSSQLKFIKRFTSPEEIFNRYGKINYVMDIYYKEAPASYMFLVSADIEFIPGSIMHEMSEEHRKDYEFDAYNEKGHAAINVNESGLNSSKIKLLKYYPINEVKEIEIISAYNTNFSFGVSKENGFYINDVLQYSYSQKITKTEPIMSAQKLDNYRPSWYYDYEHAAKETFHLNPIIFFEVGKDTNIKLYNINIAVKMTAYQDHFWNWEQELYDIGEYSQTYSFEVN